MNVYIVTEELRRYAERLVEGAKKATGYDGTADIMVMSPNLNQAFPYSFPYNPSSGTISPNTYTTYTGTGTVIPTTTITTTGTVTTAGTTNYPYNQWGTSTTQAQPQYWSYPPAIIQQPTIGPVIVETPPAKEHFEKMVLAQVQMLNDAYNLGREHGKLEGLKEGAEQIERTLDDIMDTEILQTADEVPSVAV